jgi:hypothetical protein
MLLFIIGIIVFYYCNRSVNHDNNSNRGSKKKHDIQKSQKKSTKNNRNRYRKVRFNDKVKYHYYNKNSSITTERKKINIDDFLNKKTIANNTNNISENKSPNERIDEQMGERINESWDSNFGVPLITKEEGRQHFVKIQKSNRKYEQSMSDFSEYQIDKDAIVEPEIKINPFKPTETSDLFTGQKIKDIYDAQVANPKAKPKKIKKVTPELITYENESVNNGGILCGSKNLRGTDYQKINTFGNAAFGNAFDPPFWE